MELECVESLAPDALRSPRRSPHLPCSGSRRPCPDLDITDLPDHSLLPPALSPLTCTPTPSPKRLRVQYYSPPPPPPAPLTDHPLTSLALRDVDHAVRQPRHLASTSVTPVMREEVVAWCADMTDDLDLPPAVVAVAINIFDRFLIRQKVTKSVLYPLTASCLLLACKLIMDDDIPRDDIAARSRLPLDDIYVMEAVVLSVLNWRVHVITPHEVAYELCTLYPQHVQRRQPLLEGLLLNALLDYRLAWLRATSIGVACFILSSCAMDPHPMDAKHHPVYKLAAQCGVSLSELDYCIVCLQDSINALLVEQLDDVVTDQEDA